MILFVLPIVIYSQELVYNVNIDTMQYENAKCFVSVVPSPGSLRADNIDGFGFGDHYYISLFHKKNTNQYELISFSGKIGSINIDTSLTPSKYLMNSLFVSQKIINTDEKWEYIINYQALDMSSDYKFKVFDGNGKVILSDNGFAYYGYDGRNTYVFVDNRTKLLSLKAWRFRTDASSAASQLAKKSSTPGSIMSLMPSGDFRVSLQPTANGEASIQIFDMLGKQIFSQTVQNINSPKSFIVPSSGIPRSPFIAKVKSGEETFTKKEIPIR
jgi:hypothetical protein